MQKMHHFYDFKTGKVPLQTRYEKFKNAISEMVEVEEKFWHFQISFSFWQKIHSSSKMLLWQKLVPNAKEKKKWKKSLS